MIPLLHNFDGETVLVFGGGRVGARKARRFAREARVIVVSPEFAATDFGVAECVRAAPTPADVPAWIDRVEPALLIAATDDGALNARIESEARSRSILVNRTDTHSERDVGSVVVPATVRDGDVVVAISTGGASPALSKHLRERIDDDLENAGAMAELTADIRDELQERGVPPNDRRRAVRAVVESGRVWKLLGAGGTSSRQAADDIVSDVVGEDS